MSSLSPSKRKSSSSCPVDRVDVFARTIPTDAPESDGTFEWDSTTIVVVQVHAGDTVGLGYTYTHDAAVRLIEDKLAPAIRGVDVAESDPSHAWHEMGSLLRNIGRPGLGFMSLSAVDIALWDLRARLLGQPLVDVLLFTPPAYDRYTGAYGISAQTDQRLAGAVMMTEQLLTLGVCVALLLRPYVRERFRKPAFT